MPDKNLTHGATPPAASSLSEQLLLQALNGLSLIEQRIVRTEAQNEAILASQEKADRRMDSAEESRGKMHQRINEMSINVAGIESEVGELKALSPIVKMLSDAHLERKTVRRVVKNFCKNGYVIAGGGITTVGAIWHQWDNIKSILLRLLGAKIGG